MAWTDVMPLTPQFNLPVNIWQKYSAASLRSRFQEK